MIFRPLSPRIQGISNSGVWKTLVYNPNHPSCDDSAGARHCREGGGGRPGPYTQRTRAGLTERWAVTRLFTRSSRRRVGELTIRTTLPSTHRLPPPRDNVTHHRRSRPTPGYGAKSLGNVFVLGGALGFAGGFYVAQVSCRSRRCRRRCRRRRRRRARTIPAQPQALPYHQCILTVSPHCDRRMRTNLPGTSRTNLDMPMAMVGDLQRREGEGTGEEGRKDQRGRRGGALPRRTRGWRHCHQELTFRLTLMQLPGGARARLRVELAGPRSSPPASGALAHRPN